MSIVLLFVALFGSTLSLPTSFDVRTQWPSCAYAILNQASCGGCWDFCSVAAFSDRLCLTGEAPSATVISPEPILECSGQGCGGGAVSTAWGYLMKTGDTTCTTACTSGCAPFDSSSGKSPACHQGTCDSGSRWPVTYLAGNYVNRLSSGTTVDYNKIQTELYNHGSLQTTYGVYDNFYTFFSQNPTGVYTEISGNHVGSHCVKLIGWGTQGGVNYWQYANSWGTGWADHGYFKMIRGTNIAGSEISVSEGFTKKQAIALGPEFFAQLEQVGATNSTGACGGWYDQEDVESDFVLKAAKEAVTLLSEKEGKAMRLEKVLWCQTQAVAGVNYRVGMVVDGQQITVSLFRDLDFVYHLV